MYRETPPRANEFFTSTYAAFDMGIVFDTG
jgi:hypothetical protein